MSPKERFQQTLAAKPFAEMAAKPEFQAALDAALLQMSDQMPVSNDQFNAVASHFRLEGARMFARTLIALPAKESAPPAEQIGHLKGNT